MGTRTAVGLTLRVKKSIAWRSFEPSFWVAFFVYRSWEARFPWNYVPAYGNSDRSVVAPQAHFMCFDVCNDCQQWLLECSAAVGDVLVFSTSHPSDLIRGNPLSKHWRVASFSRLGIRASLSARG